MLTNYLAMTGLSLYALILMWWKYILILPFLLVRRRQLVYPFRFAILGILACYTIDLSVSRIFFFFSQRPSDLSDTVEWARSMMILTMIAKLILGSVSLFFLCRYYETDRRPVSQSSVPEVRTMSLYQSHKSAIVMHGIIAAGIGFIASSVMSIMSISRSTSSTAAIGYLFVPMTSLLWSLPFFGFGISIGYLRKWHAQKARKITPPVVLAFGISAALFLAGTVFSAEGVYLSSLVHNIQVMNDQELRDTFDRPFFGRNKFVLGSIAGNKNASGELLHTIGMIDDDDLYEKMWSVFDVMGENRHGLAVMRLVARNKNAYPDTLEHLAKCSNDYVLGDVAGNEKTSVKTLVRLSKRKTYLVDWGLARNPETPPDILSELSQSESEYTRDPAALNPATPLKDLELLAADPVWHVRRSVATNPNAPATILDKLSADPDRSVRQMVLFNKNVTADILTKMTQDSDSYIRQSAQDALVRMNSL